MTSGTFIVSVCAAGGLIACFGFWWAARTGQFRDAAEARWLVFDEPGELEAARGSEERRA